MEGPTWANEKNGTMERSRWSCPRERSKKCINAARRESNRSHRTQEDSNFPEPRRLCLGVCVANVVPNDEQTSVLGEESKLAGRVPVKSKMPNQ